MTMPPSNQLLGKDRLPIALLHPSQGYEGSTTSGIVTLIWPYSVSQSSFSLLLVEPDFRLRRQKGQIRVHLTGSSAIALARLGVKSGDSILLSLEGVAWVKDESNEKTPGIGVEWKLQYGERIVLQVKDYL